MGTPVGLDFTSLGVRVNLLQESSEFGIVDDPVGFLTGYELGLPLWALLDSETWPPLGLNFIIDIPPW